jgi:hypothetical protein
MKTSDHTDTPLSNVIDLFSGESLDNMQNQSLVRLAPELDGLEMLYSNNAHPGKLFAMKILAWGLCKNGEVCGLIPWMDSLIDCTRIEDPLEGQFEGFYDPGIDEIFFTPPLHKVVELESSAEYYVVDGENPATVAQEIPDTIGTHAVFNTSEPHSLMLTEVISWQLLSDGTVQGMVVDDERCESTPVLPGDDCLYSAEKNDNFRYYFQHHIANKIKAKDPDALAAIALLVNPDPQSPTQ